MNDFGHIPTKGEFIETIMNEGCPAYVKKNTCTPCEAAEIIRRAGGKVVLAHPIAYANEDGLTEDDIQKIVDDMKPDGIEAYYFHTDCNNQRDGVSLQKEMDYLLLLVLISTLKMAFVRKLVW